MTAITDRYKFPLKLVRDTTDGPFICTWPIKPWSDPNPITSIDGLAHYSVFNGNDINPGLVDLALSPDQARAYNLPGKVNYLPYAIAPTTATSQLHIGNYISSPSSLDYTTLSTKDDADKLAAVCGGTVVDPSVSSAFFTINWNSETRRQWAIQYKGQTSLANVGQILQDVNANGIGSPGHWSSSQLALGILQWVPETISDGSQATASVPTPLALLPGEQLITVMEGLLPSVQVGTTAVNVTPITSGSAQLDAIAKQVAFMYSALGGK